MSWCRPDGQKRSPDFQSLWRSSEGQSRTRDGRHSLSTWLVGVAYRSPHSAVGRTVPQWRSLRTASRRSTEQLDTTVTRLNQDTIPLENGQVNKSISRQNYVALVKNILLQCPYDNTLYCNRYYLCYLYSCYFFFSFLYRFKVNKNEYNTIMLAE